MIKPSITGRPFLPAILLALLLSQLPQATAGALYKWVDENGQVRYSDRLPPKQATQKHQQLNSQGVVVSTTEATKREQETAADIAAKREAELKQAEDAAAKIIQDQKDKVLLLTFSSEDEISIARDDRIQVIDSVISLINKSVESTQKKLEQLQTNAEANFTSQGKEIPGGLAQKIEHFTRKIDNRTAQLNLKQAEKEKINQQYELDIARFRLLKSASN